MSETKHTPGPWEVRIDDASMPRVAAGLFVIAIVYGTTPSRKGRAKDLDANARLIAAAPDLLDALQILTNEAQGFMSQALAETHGVTNMRVLSLRIDEARIAIAKAEGRAA